MPTFLVTISERNCRIKSCHCRHILHQCLIVPHKMLKIATYFCQKSKDIHTKYVNLHRSREIRSKPWFIEIGHKSWIKDSKVRGSTPPFICSSASVCIFSSGLAKLPTLLTCFLSAGLSIRHNSSLTYVMGEV
jgi:hypothetical protein